MSQSGEICPICKKGVLGIYSSYLSKSGEFQFQHLKCDCCEHLPGKIAVPADQIRRRRTTLLRKRLNIKRR